MQARLDGEPRTEGLTPILLEQVLGAIELQADATEAGIASEWSWVSAVVFDDHAGWWGSARGIDADSALLCDRLEGWVNAVERPAPRYDHVHLDLNFSNILAVGNRLTGVIDLDHLGVGDRSVDLAGLAFQFEGRRHSAGIDPPGGVIDRLREAARAISGEPGWRQAVAYNAVSWLGWSGLDGFRKPIDEAKAVVTRMIAY